jgi:hypothetical protein
MYHLQMKDITTGLWARSEDHSSRDTATEQLETRDYVISGWKNDGLPKGCRVVNDAGEIVDYSWLSANPTTGENL